MKDIFVVLKQKEAEIKQLQSEIEALRVAARLLADDNTQWPAESNENFDVTAMRTPKNEDLPKKEIRAAAGGLKQFP